MWLHRKNEYEWKYIGAWLESFSQDFCSKVKSLIPDCELESVFVPFSPYYKSLEMIQDSLKIRNSIPAVIDVNDKKQNEKRAARIEELETIREQNIRNLESDALEFCVYINSTDEFKRLYP